MVATKRVETGAERQRIPWLARLAWLWVKTILVVFFAFVGLVILSAAWVTGGWIGIALLALLVSFIAALWYVSPEDE